MATCRYNVLKRLVEGCDIGGGGLVGSDGGGSWLGTMEGGSWFGTMDGGGSWLGAMEERS